MSFRRYKFLFFESKLVYTILAVSFLVLLIKFESVLFLIFSIIPILFFVLDFKFHNEIVTINEFGISCVKNREKIWEYAWDEIHSLRKITVFTNPGISILKKSDTDRLGFEYFQHNFQLCSTAKKALNLYYKGKYK